MWTVWVKDGEKGTGKGVKEMVIFLRVRHLNYQQEFMHMQVGALDIYVFIC